MKKIIFTLTIAAMAAVSMNAELVQQDIPLTLETWGWGYNSTVTVVEGGLQTQLTGEWGALSTGWDPVTDLSEWDKIIFLVESMEGCKGDWFQLKAYLRDVSEKEAHQMEGLLGNDADGSQQQYLVIDLKQEKDSFDLTQARILAVQCQKKDAKFVISRAYLEKEVVTDLENVSIRTNGIRYNILGQPVGEDYKGIVILNGKKMIIY